MARYYFTVSSLPELQLFSPPPLTVEEFFSHCTTEVSHVHTAVLKAIAEGSEDISHPVLDTWNQYADDLNHELAYQRAERLDRPHEPTRHGGRDIREAARHLLAVSSPLEAEKELLSVQWDLAESLEPGHLFDETKLILYLLKLRILHRYAQFEQQAGKDQFKSVFSHVQSRIEEL